MDLLSPRQGGVSFHVARAERTVAFIERFVTDLAVSWDPSAASRAPGVHTLDRQQPDMSARSRHRFNTALNVGLVVLLVITFTTGWIASLLGLTEFPLHKYTSIAFLVVAIGHLAMHWRSLVAQLRRRRPRIAPAFVGDLDLGLAKLRER
jgi:hypothetical protein